MLQCPISIPVYSQGSRKIEPSVLFGQQSESLIPSNEISQNMYNTAFNNKFQIPSAESMYLSLLAEMNDSNAEEVINRSIDEQVKYAISDVEMYLDQRHIDFMRHPLVLQKLQTQVLQDKNNIAHVLKRRKEELKKNEIIDVTQNVPTEKIVSSLLQHVLSDIDVLQPELLLTYLQNMKELLLSSNEIGISLSIITFLGSTSKILSHEKFRTPSILRLLVEIHLIIGGGNDSSRSQAAGMKRFLAVFSFISMVISSTNIDQDVLTNDMSEYIATILKLSSKYFTLLMPRTVGAIVDFIRLDDCLVFAAKAMGVVVVKDEPIIYDIPVEDDTKVFSCQQTVCVASSKQNKFYNLGEKGKFTEVPLNTVFPDSSNIKAFAEVDGNFCALSYSDNIIQCQAKFDDECVTSSIQFDIEPVQYLFRNNIIYIIDKNGTTHRLVMTDTHALQLSTIEDVRLPYIKNATCTLSKGQVLTAFSINSLIVITSHTANYTNPINHLFFPESPLLTLASELSLSIAERASGLVQSLLILSKSQIDISLYITSICYPEPLLEIATSILSSPPIIDQAITLSFSLVALSVYQTTPSEAFIKRVKALFKMCPNIKEVIPSLLDAVSLSFDTVYLTDIPSFTSLLTSHITPQLSSYILGITNTQASLYLPQSILDSLSPDDLFKHHAGIIRTLPTYLPKIEKMKSEPFIAPTLISLINFEIELLNNHKSGLFYEFTQNLMFMLGSLVSYPTLCSSIIHLLPTLLAKLTYTIEPSSCLTRSLTPTFKNETHTLTFQSDHPYRHNQNVIHQIRYPGAREVVIQFDERCATENGPDTLFICLPDAPDRKLHSFTGHSSNWPRSVTIPYSSFDIIFQSDGSVNDWGYLITVKVVTTQNEAESASPEAYVSSFVGFIFGEIVKSVATSLPAGPLEVPPKLSISTTSHLLTPPHKMTRQRTTGPNPARRQIQRGTSHDCTEDEETIKGFLTAIIEGNPNEADPAELLISLLKKSITSPHPAKNNETAYAERAAFAAVLHRAGLAGAALMFAFTLTHSNPPIPPKIASSWRAALRVRPALLRERQRERQNISGSDFNGLKTKVIEKAKLIVMSYPSRAETDVVINFLLSESRADEIKGSVEIRTKRAKLRTSAINTLTSLIDNDSIPSFVKFSALLPVKDFITSSAFENDIQGAEEYEHKNLRNSIRKLVMSALNKIREANNLGYLCTLFCSRLLSTPDVTKLLNDSSRLSEVTGEAKEDAGRLSEILFKLAGSICLRERDGESVLKVASKQSTGRAWALLAVLEYTVKSKKFISYDDVEKLIENCQNSQIAALMTLAGTTSEKCQAADKFIREAVNNFGKGMFTCDNEISRISAASLNVVRKLCERNPDAVRILERSCDTEYGILGTLAVLGVEGISFQGTGKGMLTEKEEVIRIESAVLPEGYVSSKGEVLRTKDVLSCVPSLRTTTSVSKEFLKIIGKKISSDELSIMHILVLAYLATASAEHDDYKLFTDILGEEGLDRIYYYEKTDTGLCQAKTISELYAELQYYYPLSLTLKPETPKRLPNTITVGDTNLSHLVNLSTGTVEDNVISASQFTVLVGNSEVKRDQNFFYEITLREMKDNTFVGIADPYSNFSDIRKYGILFNETKITYVCDGMTIHTSVSQIIPKSIIGIGVCPQYLIISMNHEILPFKIPMVNIDTITPFIELSQGTVIDYNLGSVSFTFDVLSRQEFDVRRFCIVDVPSEPFQGNFEPSKNLHDVLNTGISRFEKTVLPEDISIPPYQLTSRTTSPPVCDVSDFKDKLNQPYTMLAGSPVLLGSQNSVELPSSINFQFYRGIVGKVIKVGTNGYDIYVTPPGIVLNSIPSGFIETLPAKLSELRENVILRSNMAESLMGSYVHNKTTLILQSLAAKLSRHFLLNLFTKGFELPIEQHTRILSRGLVTFTKMATSLKIRQSDKGTVQRSHIANPRLSAKLAKDAALKAPESYKIEIMRIFTTDLTSHLTNLSDLYNYSDPSLRIETWIPAPKVLVSRTLPPEPLGFLPVVHPTCWNSKCNILVDGMQCPAFVSKAKKGVTFESAAVQNSPIKLSLFSVPRYINFDNPVKHLASVSGILRTLGIIFEGTISDELSDYLKQEILPQLTSLLGKDLPIFDSFLFDGVASILTRLPWLPKDLTSSTEVAFYRVGLGCSRSIKEWEPLSEKAQRAVILTAQTTLLNFSMKKALLCETGSISDLYDLYNSGLPLTTVFDQIVSATIVISALSFDPPFKTLFPEYLFAVPWATAYGSVLLREKIDQLPDDLAFAPNQSILESKDFIYEKGESMTRRPALSIVDAHETLVREYETFIAHLSLMHDKWIARHDEVLRKYINDTPIISVETIPPALSAFPYPIIYARATLMKKLDEFAKYYSCIVGFGNDVSLLGKLFSSSRASITTEFKMDTIESIVLEGIDDPVPRSNLYINRFSARHFLSTGEGEPMFQQIVSQITKDNLISLKRNSVPWHVELSGEGATDAGGPGRDVFTEVCSEVMLPPLQLFLPTPNAKAETGMHQDSLVPDPRGNPLHFVYVGALMAVCYTCKLPEPWRLAPFVWNSLTMRDVTAEDVMEVDEQLSTLVRAISGIPSEMTENEFDNMFDYTFSVETVYGQKVELIEGGFNKKVTLSNREDFIRKLLNFKKHEFDEPLARLREGFQIFFPQSVLSLISPWELEMIVCGSNLCPVEELKALCTYPNDATSDMLFRVLESFTPEERRLFIKFACGKFGLPPPGVKWSQKIQISFRHSDVPDPVKPLPKSATCSSSITIPIYETEEWMAKKIRTAIVFGADIDQDHQADLATVRMYT